jgi:hypothetical protein
MRANMEMPEWDLIGPLEMFEVLTRCPEIGD